MESVIREVRPRFVIVENVPDLVRDRDAFGLVLGGLAKLGFDAEWSLLSACAVGAPHARDRLFLVAYPAGDDGEDPLLLQAAIQEGRASARTTGGDARREWWVSEPAVDRVAYGAARSMVFDELHALGNAVVPQVAEYIGRLVMAGEVAA
jgi:DNA (cytosine-5)-methyltransferase 1